MKGIPHGTDSASASIVLSPKVPFATLQEAKVLKGVKVLALEVAASGKLALKRKVTSTNERSTELEFAWVLDDAKLAHPLIKRIVVTGHR